MAASVLNSPRAVEVSMFVVREPFVKLRQLVLGHKDLQPPSSINLAERKIGTHDDVDQATGRHDPPTGRFPPPAPRPGSAATTPFAKLKPINAALETHRPDESDETAETAQCVIDSMLIDGRS